jgi:hypothetical protein
MNRYKRSFLVVLRFCAVAGFVLAAGAASLMFGQTAPLGGPQKMQIRHPSEGETPPRMFPHTHAGPYEVLARDVIEHFRAGQFEAAARVGAVLEHMFALTELRFKTFTRAKYDKIDEALDKLAKPIIRHFTMGDKLPEAAQVEAAYTKCLEELKLMDLEYYPE